MNLRCTNGLHIYYIVLFTFLVLGCDSDGKNSSQPVKEIEKSTQIILKVQPFTYDDAEKTRVDGDYLKKKSVTVPKTLSGQNKWFMFEGPVLENDKVAYRYYADYRHRFDIYGKKVNDLVMDTVSWDYHNIMDWGSDILKVGNSLGMGSPGIFYNDTIYTLSEWTSKVIEIVKEEDDISILRTTFLDLKIEEHTFDLVQDWTISAGEFWSEIDLKVVDGSLPEGMSFATGIVKHLPKDVKGTSNGAFFGYSWGIQSFHDQDLGMAIMAGDEYKPKSIENDLSHLYVFEESTNGAKYRFMAQWKEGLDGPQSEAEFMNNVKDACKGL